MPVASRSAPPHELLGIPANANAKQIHKAFRRLARKTHPDYDRSEGAAERFISVKAAHDEMLRRLDAGEPPPRPVYESIHPSPEFIRPAMPPAGLEGQLSLSDFWRPALYLGSILVWFLAMGAFLSVLTQATHILGPPSPPKEGSEPVKEHTKGKPAP